MTTRVTATAKWVLRSLLGGQALGALDYVRFPEFATEDGGPLNAQPARQALVHAVIEHVNPSAIVETGTYRGTTTEFMADLGLPVFTVERKPRNCGFARMRLRRRRNVTLRLGDSREALRAWFDGPLRHMADRTLFFYLDAHGTDDLPLAEEIAIIFGHCRNAVVMIDDFLVPHDAGYGYDTYGSGKALTPDYVQPAIAAAGLCAFYPSTPSSEDGGARRGCVILASPTGHGATLTSCRLVRAA
jgi:predicted O-methyltransferase YrrM